MNANLDYGVSAMLHKYRNWLLAGMCFKVWQSIRQLVNCPSLSFWSVRIEHSIDSIDLYSRSIIICSLWSNKLNYIIIHPNEEQTFKKDMGNRRTLNKNRRAMKNRHVPSHRSRKKQTYIYILMKLTLNCFKCQVYQFNVPPNHAQAIPKTTKNQFCKTNKIKIYRLPTVRVHPAKLH